MNVGGVTPRRSTTVSRAPEYFEDIAKIAVDDSMQVEKAIESWDRQRWGLAVEENLKSIDTSGAWIKANLSPENSAIPCKMEFKHKLNDHEQVSRYKKNF